MKVIKTETGYELVKEEFDLNQHKNSYDDWIKAFEIAISNYAQYFRKVFIGLSSGYDSGCIACELTKQGVDFKAYSIVGDENTNTLLERHDRLFRTELIFLQKTRYDSMRDWIQKLPDYKYIDKHGTYNYKKDKAGPGFSEICFKAMTEGMDISISGGGCDEIISDYAINGKKRYKISNFSGIFPEDLSTIYPWHNFYNGTQVKFLNKEEHIARSWNVKTFYPYLDHDVIQEYLWLKAELKNRHYKAPLREYFIRNNFPFEEDKKKGFNSSANLV